MKAVIAAALLAACGHAAPTPARMPSNSAPIDAAVADQELDAGADADSDESCSDGTDQPMRADDADGNVSITSCEPAASEGEDDHARGTAHEDLVFAREGVRLAETVNEWSYPDYDGERASTSLVGVIGAPGRDQAVLIEHTSSSYDGNGDTSETSAVLQVMTVQHGAWVKVTELAGSKIEVDVAADGSARIDVDGDTRTMRWDGAAVTP